jgi:ribosome-binding protein aMBF1 (putative translation factor)
MDKICSFCGTDLEKTFQVDMSPDKNIVVCEDCYRLVYGEQTGDRKDLEDDLHDNYIPSRPDNYEDYESIKRGK